MNMLRVNCRLNISHILVDCIEYDIFGLTSSDNNFSLTDIFNNGSPNNIKRSGLYTIL